MVQQVVGSDAFAGLTSQQRANHAARLGRYAFGDGELAAKDFGEQRVVLGVIERVAGMRKANILLNCIVISELTLLNNFILNSKHTIILWGIVLHKSKGW